MDDDGEPFAVMRRVVHPCSVVKGSLSGAEMVVLGDGGPEPPAGSPVHLPQMHDDGLLPSAQLANERDFIGIECVAVRSKYIMKP